MANRSCHIIDTGPLVALINASDAHHDWAKGWFARLKPPLLTCEPVLAEADHLLEKADGKRHGLLELLERGVLEVGVSLSNELPAIIRLKRVYADIPMSLADACVVRMAEMHDKSTVWTTDRHFRFYRKNRRNVIPLIVPETI